MLGFHSTIGNGPPGAPIDYLSMEITLMENGDITLTNRDKAMKFLEEAGEQDCIPTTKPPRALSTAAS